MGKLGNEMKNRPFQCRTCKRQLSRRNQPHNCLRRKRTDTGENHYKRRKP